MDIVLYRFTYNKRGIYDELKKKMTKDQWLNFLKSEAATWLPKPNCNIYDNDTVSSWFTELGYKVFMNKTMPYIKQFLDDKNIQMKVYILDQKKVVIYKDKYQIIIK